MLCKPDYPVDPVTTEILRNVDEIASAMGLSYFVAGAMARDLVLTHVFGISIGRATRDVDFGIAVADWAQFRQIKEALEATGLFVASDRSEHRLQFRVAPGTHGVPVDLIPFAGVEEENRTIRWPPGMHEVMSVAGFEDARRSAVTIQVNPNLKVPVASLPGLAILKLFAWLDRGHENAKDALDLLAVVRNYAVAGQTDRLYGEDSAVMEQAAYELDVAGAILLGRDAARIATPETLAQLTSALAQPAIIDRLITHAARGVTWADEVDRFAVANKLIQAFRAGLTD